MSETKQKPGPLTMSAERFEQLFAITMLCETGMGCDSCDRQREMLAERAAHAETREQLEEANKIIESVGVESDHFCKQADTLREQLAQAQLVLELCKRYFYDRRPIEPTSRMGKLVSSIDAALRAKQEPPQALCGEVSEVRREHAFRDEPCDLPKGHTGSHRANGVRWMTEPPQALPPAEVAAPQDDSFSGESQ